MSDDLIRELRSIAPSLRPSERRIADHVLNNPNAAVDLNITDLAQECETSVATVVRFSRSLGFSGYSDFRLALAASVGREQVSRAEFPFSDTDIDADDDAAAVIAKIAYHEARAIEATAAALDPDVLDAVAGALAVARRVDIYGVASSGIAAADLQQKLHRIGLLSYSWSDVHLALTSAALLGDDCVAIGFSHSGQTIEVADSLAAARASGATTVLVTNFASAPIAHRVDHVLTTSASETRYRPGAMSSRIAQLAVIDFLFVRIAQRLSATMSVPLQRTYDAVQAHRLSYPRSRAKRE
jgi:DNA-binding MurR/RpiR family transcriptional regulator